MQYRLRIIAGELRGRRFQVRARPGVRPLADRAREALFNILATEVPGRPFYDLFAGSGAVGLEAVSRGASRVEFVEQDRTAVRDLAGVLSAFHVDARALIARADVYRWATRWQAPAEPAIVFLGPPYEHLRTHRGQLRHLIQGLQARLAPGSYLIVQAEGQAPVSYLLGDSEPASGSWDVRRYGRTVLAIWHKAVPAANPPSAAMSQPPDDATQDR